MGRDGEPVDGLMTLYDATGKDHYFQEAEKIALDVANSLDDDYFWRSGYGVGPFWGINALVGQAWNGSHLLGGLSPFLERASSRTSRNYDQLLKTACGMVRRLIKSIDEDYGGTHRTSCSFLMRRYFVVAILADDDELKAELNRMVDNMLAKFAEDGDEYYKAGHHCGAYLEFAP